MSFTSVDLPEPETPVTTVITPSGNVTSRFLRLFSFAPRIVSAAPFGVPPLRPHRNRYPARNVRPGQRIRIAHDLFRRAVRHQAPAMPPRARPQIDHIIRAPDRLFIVLHDQHGVAQVAQIFQRSQQPAVIAMMQSDRGLIQHVQHAAQLRSNLRRQPNALPLAARQRCRRAIERDISQPHRIQKLQPLHNLRA